jgi:hypothetical protein
MRLRTALVVAALVMVALPLGCKKGGGGGTKATQTPAPSATPAGTTVASDDGKLSLLIPNGAMPAGTEVSITSVAHDQLPAELAQLAGSGTGYRLEPDGLTFSTPATATLTIDRAELDDPADTQSAYALVSFNDTAGREVLDSETAWDGGATITVSSQLEHFSYITRTKGSLQVRLEGHSNTRGVGESYRLSVDIQDTRDDQVLLEDITVTWLASGVIRGNTTPFPAGQTLGPGFVVGMGFNDQFDCSASGTGANGVNVQAKSSIPATPTLSTLLRVTINEPVRCAEGFTPGLEEPPSPTPGTPPELHLEQTIGCEHTQPGVQSELQKRGRVTDANGLPVQGVTVTEEVTGPGIIDEFGDTVSGDIGDDGTNENGEFSITWPIRSGGPYSATVTEVTLPGGTKAVLDATSTTSSQYTVGQVCTPP